MIFKNNNFICSSPKHSISRDDFNSTKFLSWYDKISTKANLKFSESFEDPFLDCKNNDKVKNFSSEGLVEPVESKENICEEGAPDPTKASKR